MKFRTSKHCLLYLLIFFLIILIRPFFAQEQKQVNDKHVKIGIDEKLGSTIPLDLTFLDENGKKVKLSSLVNKPTVMALVYYHCPAMCSPMLMGLAEVVDRTDLEPGKDYNIVTISFDPKETPAYAKKWREERLSTMKKSLPNGAWTFMTGDSVSIRKLTDASGFYYQKDRDSNYAHMSSLIMLSPQGKITRYILGTQFNPVDLKMAVINAQQGLVMPTLNKILAFCFSYERKGDKYVLNITRMVGTVVLFMVTVVFAVLTIKGKKKKVKK
ncbi:MAG: SCO family protein [Bacteroidota bacterium]|nr:SCO family protein [Bacteroidota bacterium]MDP4195073.1 SCO family protein [Bacteroidota bacterium]